MCTKNLKLKKNDAVSMTSGTNDACIELLHKKNSFWWGESDTCDRGRCKFGEEDFSHNEYEQIFGYWEDSSVIPRVSYECFDEGKEAVYNW